MKVRPMNEGSAAASSPKLESVGPVPRWPAAPPRSRRREDATPPPVTPAATIEDHLHQLMSDHERPLYGYLLALVQDPDVALDCTQETFLRAYEFLRNEGQISRKWLYTVARNLAMDVFRGRRRVSPNMEALEQVSVEDSPDGRMVVQQVLDHLPILDRRVLHLSAVMGFRSDEIGTMLGLSADAVRQRLHRARHRFRVLYVEAAA